MHSMSAYSISRDGLSGSWAGSCSMAFLVKANLRDVFALYVMVLPLSLLMIEQPDSAPALQTGGLNCCAVGYVGLLCNPNALSCPLLVRRKKTGLRVLLVVLLAGKLTCSVFPLPILMACIDIKMLVN